MAVMTLTDRKVADRTHCATEYRDPGARVKERIDRRPVLITGGAGFMGTNLAHRLLSAGRRVVIFDNFSRPGVKHNLRALRAAHGDDTQVLAADVRDELALGRAVADCETVYHLASQPCTDPVTQDPIGQFETNARGTLNLLEAIRLAPAAPALIHASTSRVYGPLEDVALREAGDRYEPEDPVLLRSGISEMHPLDFYGPSGCSKGAAEQYVLDYARNFGLPAVVFRLSCVYGPYQTGAPGRGWVAECLDRALRREPVTVFGDGRQVRDLLYVDDVVTALILAEEKIGILRGRAFNIGGGPDRTLSPRELVQLITELAGERPRVQYEQWRPADQRYYVSDYSLFATLAGWQPKTAVRSGVEQLYRWMRDAAGSVLDSERAVLLALAGSDARG
jgi:CDP-paratose 2-epimerase